MKSLFSWIILPIAFWISSIHCDPDSDYAHPRILILGPTGVGKSSLASVLAGCTPGDCLFPVCTSINSCTKNTSIAQAKFIGNFSGPDVLRNAENVTIIDTPGFGDGDLEEPKLVGEMVDVLKEDLKSANLIVLCFDGIRWDAQINAMLETLQTLFGQNFWRNAIIEVTKWAFDEKDIQDRKRRGITEEDTLRAINNQLKKNFNLNHSLPGVFVDSFAVHYPDDEVQTRFFLNYSLMLWEAAKDRKPFSFDTLGQVQDGTTKACGIDIDCCDKLTDEINALKSSIYDLDRDLKLDILTHKILIDNNNYNIVTNRKTIATIIQDIETNSETIATNNQDIKINREAFGNGFKEIVEMIGEMTRTVLGFTQTNAANIATNNQDIETNRDTIATNTQNIANNIGTISTLTEKTSRFVSYCGYSHSHWFYKNQHYKFTVPFRLVTDQNSFSVGGLDIGTGVFTAPTKGTYLVTLNFYTPGDSFGVYINKNGNDLKEGYVRSRSDMSGRTIILDLQINDELKLRVDYGQGNIDYTTFCISLLH